MSGGATQGRAAGFALRVTMRPDLWVADSLVDSCEMCNEDFGFFVVRHLHDAHARFRR